MPSWYNINELLVVMDMEQGPAVSHLMLNVSRVKDDRNKANN